MAAKIILDFTAVKKEDVSVVGGKGANLGEMTAAGIRVPQGFVIIADAYRNFLQENKITEIIEKKLREVGEDEEALSAAAHDFRKRIKDGKFSSEMEKQIADHYFRLGENARVAVRSSATAEDLPDASFAGQQETYLNVQGLDGVLEQVRNCYASLWGNRAVNYRLHQGYDQNSVSIAVVIQKMVESEKAGVLFTENPVSKKENEMQINAAYGLGESVVGGSVTADSYIVDKTGTVLSVTVGSKETQIIYGDKGTVRVAVDEKRRKQRALSDREIAGLVQVGLQIEKHYGIPMDIEWAIKDEEIYILQARAITTLKEDENNEEKNIQKYIKGKKLSRSMRANMAFLLEKMPFAYRALDFDFMIAINDQKAKTLAEGGLVFNSDPQIDDDGIQTLPVGLKRINQNIFHLFKIIKEMQDFAYCAGKCREFLPAYERALTEIKSKNFEDMCLRDCRDFMAYSYKFTEDVAYARFKYALFPTMLVFKKYSKIMKRINGDYTAFDFYRGLDNKTNVVNRAMAHMAKEIVADKALKEAIISGADYASLCAKFAHFKQMTAAFLKSNGFKSDYNCYCLAARTFIEDPERIVHILRPMLQTDVRNETYGGVIEFKACMQKLKMIYGNRYARLAENIQYFRYFHWVREESQYIWESLFYNVRKCVARINILFLGDDHVSRGIANLFYRELMEALTRGYLNDADLEKIKRRNEKFPLATKVWEASKVLVFKAEGDELHGVSGSTGVAVGKVCIICSPQEFYKMQKGDILVCHLTDPEWTPLFQLASAVVADTGAALSHAAIVAREFHIPAVLGVGFATTKWKDGDRIQVDGTKGIVRSL